MRREVQWYWDTVPRGRVQEKRTRKPQRCYKIKTHLSLTPQPKFSTSIVSHDKLLYAWLSRFMKAITKICTGAGFE
jgi:hypothetical protein